ncbi:hypothetical protein C8K61_102149 [Pseudomonas sp. GV071]|nr:hypothetical protein C8K61_102149 [Pseudomonas sp. GV071]
MNNLRFRVPSPLAPLPQAGEGNQPSMRTSPLARLPERARP